MPAVVGKPSRHAYLLRQDAATPRLRRRSQSPLKRARRQARFCGRSIGCGRVFGHGHATALDFHLDLDTRRQVEFRECLDSLRCRIDDIDQSLVRAHFELLAAFLVDVRRA